MFNFKKEKIADNEFVAVSSGKIIPIETTKDEAFASKALGDGVAIEIDSDYIVAPCNGKITMIYPTMHAFGITSNEGVDVLVHIGINTVNAKGKGFKKFKKEGDIVKAGDKIIKLDTYYLRNENYDLTTMELFPSCEKKIELVRTGQAKEGKTVVAKY